MTITITITGMTKSFDATQVLRGIDLKVEDGELLALLGPSGSGKTTLLRIIAGLDWPDAGSLVVAGQDWLALPAQKRRIGFVFQQYALFPHMSVRDNIAFGLTVRPRGERPTSTQINATVDNLLNLLQIDHLADRFPSQLSGGQRQRVGLARALFGMPPLVVLDEPNASLDARGDAALLGTIKKLKAMNVTTIIVSHRSNLLELADKILLMIDGQAAKFGDARTVVEEMAGKRRVIQPGGAPGGPKAPPAMANEKGMGA